MGLISYGIAVGVGYYLAQPDGQRRLTQLRQRAAAAVAQNPQARGLHERGGDLVGDRVLVTRTARPARHAKTDLTTTSGVTTTDVVTADVAGDNPGADPSAPARGRRLRRQLNQKNRRRRAEHPSDPPGHRAR